MQARSRTHQGRSWARVVNPAIAHLAHVYTDGSIGWNPGGPEGWAFVATDRWGEITEQSCGGPAEPGNSNNRAELRGMMLALTWLAGRPAVIHSDSQYVVRGMNEWCHSWVRRKWQRQRAGEWEPVPNNDLWRGLIGLRSPEQHIVWVRGHAGNVFNERADVLAGLAMTCATGASTRPALNPAATPA